MLARKGRGVTLRRFFVPPMKHLFWLLCLLLSFGSVSAQAPATPAPAPPAAAGAAATPAQTPPAAAAPVKAKEKAVAVLDMVKQGGFTIWFLMALSVIMVALIIFLFLTLRRGAVVSDYFMKTADSLIRKQDYLGLLAVCNRRNEAISSITQKALDFATKNPMATFDEVREVTEAEGQRQAGQLYQRVTYLSDLANVAPMVGLLGTVIGLMSEFTRISKADMQQAQMEFAGGTAEALINTAAGLVIAIPAMMIASLYRGKVNGLVSELESAATHIMALLSAQYKRVTAARAAQSAAAAAQPARRA
ncbi:MAG: MotA/TolQ/ExbB proton channel [Verrucomicrobiales bacterium]|nr:MotA/TolQ/ExbB proton channel [Verrucomicrobiales bacterium]